jgi:hypothetical protein
MLISGYGKRAATRGISGAENFKQFCIFILNKQNLRTKTLHYQEHQINLSVNHLSVQFLSNHTHIKGEKIRTLLFQYAILIVTLIDPFRNNVGTRTKAEFLHISCPYKVCLKHPSRDSLSLAPNHAQPSPNHPH